MKKNYFNDIIIEKMTKHNFNFQTNTNKVFIYLFQRNKILFTL